MEASVSLGVGAKFVTFRVGLTRIFQIGLEALRVIIRIDEIIAGVIGWIDVNYLDLAKIGLLEKFQDLKIVTFDD